MLVEAVQRETGRKHTRFCAGRKTASGKVEIEKVSCRCISGMALTRDMVDDCHISRNWMMDLAAVRRVCDCKKGAGIHDDLLREEKHPMYCDGLGSNLR